MPDNSPSAGSVSPESEQRPPLGSWSRMYALVLVTEAVLVTVFYWFTQYFA